MKLNIELKEPEFKPVNFIILIEKKQEARLLWQIINTSSHFEEIGLKDFKQAALKFLNDVIMNKI